MISTRIKNSLFGLVLLIAGLVLLYTAHRSPWPGLPEEDPMFMPRILLTLWIVLAGLIFIGDLRHAQSILPAMRVKPLLIVGVLLGLTAAAMPRLGFLPVSFFFFGTYAFVTGYRNIPALVVLAAAFSGATWFLFNVVLEIQLPPIPFGE